MRLIDADELPITETWALVNGDNNSPERISFAPLSCILKKDIDAASTVEKSQGEEKPIGEWIKGPEISRTMIVDNVLSIDYKDYTCSRCGLVLDRLLYHVDGSPFYKFCPTCGAEMKGDRK